MGVGLLIPSSEYSVNAKFENSVKAKFVEFPFHALR
jgi:hypothetical protein